MPDEIPPQPKQTSVWLSDHAILVYLALATVVAHWLAGHRYGFQRDELATLEDSRHLAWGYVAYPPVTPFFGRISLILFGTSLAGFRLFAAIAQGTTVVLAGLMAREMGGRRGAQLMAAAATLPFCIAGGEMMQYVAFDCMFWVLAAYFVVRLSASGDPRWWLGIGAAVGFGFETKYTMGVFALAIAGGALLTEARRFYKSKWLWYGVALAVLIFLPNLIWQARNHFISLEFLQHIHARDVRIGRAKNFLPEQLLLTLGGVPLVLGGLYFTWIDRSGKRFRTLGWMYLISLTVLLLTKGRAYYLAPAYPMLYAAGSVWLEDALRRMAPMIKGLAQAVAWTVLVAGALLISSVTLPIATVDSAWAARAMKVNEDFREQIGWPELVAQIAQIRDALPPEDQKSFGILAANYGEAGAINLYGPEFGLPPVISGVNSFWRYGYGNPPPGTLIVVGHTRDDVNEWFKSCRTVARVTNRYGIENEETRAHPEIFICRDLRLPWPEFWRNYRHFG